MLWIKKQIDTDRKMIKKAGTAGFFMQKIFVGENFKKKKNLLTFVILGLDPRTQVIMPYLSPQFFFFVILGLDPRIQVIMLFYLWERFKKNKLKNTTCHSVAFRAPSSSLSSWGLTPGSR